MSGYLVICVWLDRLLPHIKGNVGFVFTKEDLAEVRDLLLANKVTIKKLYMYSCQQDRSYSAVLTSFIGKWLKSNHR